MWENRECYIISHNISPWRSFYAQMQASMRPSRSHSSMAKLGGTGATTTLRAASTLTLREVAISYVIFVGSLGRCHVMALLEADSL